MTTIAITSADLRNPRPYIAVMESLGAEVRTIIPPENRPAGELMVGVGGLLLPGGPDIDPDLYGAEPPLNTTPGACRLLDDLDLRLLRHALEQDLPVLAICRGMQLLNVALGGRLIPQVPDHEAETAEGQQKAPRKHVIYLAPGAKAAAVIGSAGFFRVNSLHRQGLREAQRSPRLMSTAYSVDDGLIEGLESPEHSWVIGLQCRPERQEEVPRSFTNLFAAFLDRAEMFLSAGAGPRAGAIITDS